jgi:phosphomannomutase
MVTQIPVQCEINLYLTTGDKFIFDVDGTLTPSREVMDPNFKEWFLHFITRYPVILISGSDRDKTIEQVGLDIVENVEYCFSCAGNVVYHKNQLVHQSMWTPPVELIDHLTHALVRSPWPTRNGNHIETRTGLVNFSVIGRNCTREQREEYYHWDQEHQERAEICKRLKELLPDLTFEIGGQISIDIFPNGHDKSQILSYIKQPVIFFGDRMEPGGNDHALAQSILDTAQGRCYNVINWTDTQKELLKLCPNV